MLIPIENVLFTLTVAMTAWGVASCIVLATARLFWSRIHSNGIILGIFVALGLLPIILMPPVLLAVAQPEFNVFGFDVYPVEILLVTCYSSLSGILSSHRAVREVDNQFGELLEIARIPRNGSYEQIAKPYILSAMLPSLRAAIPIAILLIVILEWARGGADGLGGIIQSAIQGGDWGDRWNLILCISIPSLLFYYIMIWVENWWNKRYVIQHHVEASTGNVEYVDEWAPLLRGILFGAILVAIMWHLMFSLGDIDISQRYTPIRFITQLQNIEGRRVFLGGDLLAQLLRALYNTIWYATVASIIGVLASGMFALFARVSNYSKAILSIVSSISQSVPIFIFIPLYISLFENKVLVALLVCVSVTYFIGYEIFRTKLEQIPEQWYGLRQHGVLAKQPILTIARSVMYFYAPMMRSVAVIAIVVVLPTGAIAALVADMFLELNGLAELAVINARTDLFVNLLVIIIIYSFMITLYLAGKIIERRYVL